MPADLGLVNQYDQAAPVADVPTAAPPPVNANVPASDPGLGLAPPDNAVAPPQAVAAPAALPAAAPVAAAPPESAQADPYAYIRKVVPQWKDNPVGAIGFVLSNIAAGFRGQPLPSDKVIEQAQNAQLIQLKQLDLGLQVADHGLKLLNQAPADQRDAIATKLGGQFEQAVPGITDTLKQLSKTPGAEDLINKMTTLGPAGRQMVLALSGNSREGMLAVLKDKDLMDRVTAADDRALMPTITAKFQTIDKMIASSPAALADTRNGTAPLTLANFSQINAQIAAKNPAAALSPQEMETLGRNESLQTQLGLVAPSTSLKAAQAGAEEDARVPGQIKVAQATATANASNAAPDVKAFTDESGNRTLAITKRDGNVVTVDLGGANTKFDMAKFRSDLALKAAGKDVKSPDVQQLSPAEAKHVNDSLGTSDPLKSMLGDLMSGTGGGPSAPAAVAPPAAAQGTQAAPYTPKSQTDFDAIPSGGFYTNPADGKLYKKK